MTGRPRAIAAAGFAAFALGWPGAVASAHPSLMRSQPQTGEVVPEAPREVVLSFNEGVIAAGSRVQLARPGGRPMRLRGTSRRGKRELVAPVGARLAPAVYEVRWSAIGTDGHSLSGSFRFGVATAAGGPPPGAERLGGAAMRGEQAAASDGVAEVVIRWLGLVAAGVLLAGALLRSGTDGARRRWLAVGALAALASASVHAVADALRVSGHASIEVLTAQPTGVLALVRLGAVLAVGVVGIRALERTPRAARFAFGAAGATALVTYALAGHVQTATDAPGLAFAAQVLHVLAAGIWMGGLVVLLVDPPRDVRVLRVAAPVAAAAVATLVVTGVIAALREIDVWHFLRWSDYGRVVIAKAGLLLALAPVVAVAALALRRGRRPLRTVRAEAAGAVTLVLLASILAGLVPGRGQPRPAQRGNLLTGASFATATLAEASVPLTLAPARPGANTIVVGPPATGRSLRSRSISVELRCACARAPVRARLRRMGGGSGVWAARVDLPTRGTWVAGLAGEGVRVRDQMPLVVGDAPVAGSTPRSVLMTADLSGPDAERCRAHAQGAILALGRFNALGGLSGGRKVVLSVEDDGGEGSRASTAVRRARTEGALALLAPCGAGGAAALRTAGDLPAIAADPVLPVTPGRRIWRTAGDPRAEGEAIARYVLDRRALSAPGAPGRVAAIVAAPGSAAAARHAGGPTRARLAALEATLRGAGVSLVRFDSPMVLRPEPLRRTLDPRRWAAVFIDGDGAQLSAALHRLSAKVGDVPLVTAPIVAASPLLDERFEERSGSFGSSGAIASPAEVLPGSVDGIRYARQVRAFFAPGRASISGLRGYVAGLALAEGLRDGDSPSRITARLRRPRVFTDALVTPWRSDAPTSGGPLFAFLSPRLLPTALSALSGGHRHSGTYFERGTWLRVTTELYGPRLGLGGAPPRATD